MLTKLIDLCLQYRPVVLLGAVILCARRRVPPLLDGEKDFPVVLRASVLLLLL